MTYQYFATVGRGLEDIASQEIISLGGDNVKADFTGVHFQGDLELLYRVNLWCRTIFRVLWTLKVVPSYDSEQLYQSVKKFDWSDFLSPSQTFVVHCTGKSPRLNHSHFTALQVKRAIVDQQQEKYGVRSDIDTENPDVIINAHIRENKCTLSLDSSGESLHRRGYRPAMGRAPLKETLAAALLYMTDWTPDLPLVDPLCGSGTFAIEATLMALNIAPGLYRREFAFQRWNNYDSDLWDDVFRKAEEAEKDTMPIIVGSDADEDVVLQAQSNARACGFADKVKFYHQKLIDVEAPADHGILICNPPYGKRLSETEQLFPFYKLLGDVLKQRFKGWTAYILCGNKELSKKVGLRTSRRIPVDNGGIPCTLLKYDLY
ncbi:class I SAM-dependent RNA methyltransferase [Cyanobacterium stanieri LEGE 03274]|uniref:Class I SAM-dependent RNA methyltransferase n=1 Tax=Cyanobacterium stanieri LEGE 03274 TaxID=1828756 RepID=A0ABR9V631_9CHRO|nr:class I SAM-dependent RNA methyltransferase [Cyanobacterium stanieri]MBE9223327.1 class I SAM-dependent RNA methyltransferase [Cyanobacterium stanieri LEGE 03274]